jgi:1-acyl-sn-glycerol-3-phosphate acyltransferase
VSSPPLLPRRALRGFERVSVPLLEAINRSPRFKDATRPTWRWGGANFVLFFSRNLYEVHGFEHVERLSAPRGLLLAANHRSYFDLFFLASHVIEQAPHLTRRPIFPVRKDFFVDHPVGFGLNLLLSSGSMWPPIFRDERRTELNPVAMAQVGAALQAGTFCGIHPEGTRGRGPDPYQLGRAKPGIGHVLLAADPEVRLLPAWILGMSNDFVATARRNFRAEGQRGEAVRMWFGAPLTAAELVARGGGEPQAIAEAVLAEIRALGELDRARGPTTR